VESEEKKGREDGRVEREERSEKRLNVVFSLRSALATREAKV
jgi:hypothetical protein